MKILKRMIIICFSIGIVFVLIGAHDYQKSIYNYEKPYFAQIVNGFDDGGSGTYVGLGYSIDIGGYLDIDLGYVVTESTFYVFGKEIESSVRHN